jgi:hypothetical protein
MRGDLGPPNERGGGPTPETASHHQHRSLTRNQHPQFNHRAGYGYVWREGFGFGFRDALRLAARLPPEAWPTLEALASEFALAGGDG